METVGHGQQRERGTRSRGESASDWTRYQRENQQCTRGTRGREAAAKAAGMAGRAPAGVAVRRRAGRRCTCWCGSTV